MPNLETAWLYQGLCLLEGTNLSEGRGTETPFMLVGAPWLDNQKLYEKLVTIKDPMDNFELIEFIPKSIPAAKYPKYEGEKCFGLRINNLVIPIEWTIQLLAIINSQHPEQFRFLKSNFIDKLYGSDEFRVSIKKGKDFNQIIEQFSIDEEEFSSKRKNYLIY